MGFPTGLNHASANADKHFSHNLVQAFTTLSNTSPFPTNACGDVTTNVTWLGGNANDNIGLTDPFGTVPDFRPVSGSPALTNATDFACLTGFDVVSYRGAFGADNWLAGWAKFDF
jgi:hypothetical protein